MPKIKNSVFWIISSQFVLLVTGFTLLKFLTVNLSVEDFGYYSLCMSIVLFVRQVVYDPISITAAKAAGSAAHIPANFSSSIQVVKKLTDMFGFLLLLASIIIGVLASISASTFGVFAIFLMCAFYLCANAAQGVYINVLNSIGERKSAAIYSMLDSILKISVVGIVFWIFKANLEYTIACIAVSAFAVFLLMRRYINSLFVISKINHTQLVSLSKRMVVLSLPFYIPTVISSLKGVSDKWILTTFAGVDELAAYNVLFQIGYTPIVLLIGIAQTYLAPEVYRLSVEATTQNLNALKILIKKIILSSFALSLIAAAIAMYAGDWLLELFTGAHYQDLASLIPIFIVSGAVAGLSGILQVIAIGVLKSESVSKLMNLSVLLYLATFIIFVALFGFVGAAFALLLTSVVSAFLYWTALYSNLYTAA